MLHFLYASLPGMYVTGKLRLSTADPNSAFDRLQKEYHCQHKNVSRPDRPDPKKSPKNLHCPALMTIALLKDNLVQSTK